MKAYRLPGWRQQPQLVDVPVPEPRGGQVLLKVAGNGICQSDLHLMEWEASPPHLHIEPPMTIGHEVGGWVEAPGPGVTGLETGQPVLVTMAGCGHCRYCAQGWNNYCRNKTPQVGMGLDGGLAEYVVAPEGALVPVDGDPAEMAPLVDAGLSSYHAIKRVLPMLTGGARVVVIGIGGLGHLAVEILKNTTPAHVTALDLDDRALELARRLGADQVLPSSEESLEAIGPASVDVVLDFVGAAPTIGLAARMVKPLSHIVVAGRGPGEFGFRHDSMPYGTFISTTFGGSKLELMELVSLAESGLVKAHIEKYPLARVDEAFERLRKGEISGRAVIVP